MNFRLDIVTTTPSPVPAPRRRRARGSPPPERFNPVERAVVTLTRGGTAISSTPRQGVGASFALTGVSTGTELDLRIVVNAPPAWNYPSTPLLDFVQRLVVAGTETEPTVSAGPGGPFAGHFNPRVSLRPAGAPEAAQRVHAAHGATVTVTAAPLVVLDVDLSFLDVTQHPHTVHGGEQRLYYFAGRQPPLWAVVVSPEARAARRPSVFLFFRPVGDHYEDPSDFQSYEVVRYLRDPPSTMPWYITNQAPDQAPGVISRYAWPNCGWTRQVISSRKPVVLAYPVPVGGDFGVAAGREAPRVLASLIKALWADGLIGVGHPTGVTRNKLAVGMYSFGGESGFRALSRFGPQIDELYLFDPNGIGTHGDDIAQWYRRGSKRLRMIGGFADRHASMLSLANELAVVDGTVSVWPSTHDWRVSDALWSRAHYEPHLGLDCIAPVGGPETDITRRTGVRYSVEPGDHPGTSGRLLIQSTDAAGAVVGPVPVGRYSPGEVSWPLWLYHTDRFTGGRSGRIETVGRLRRVVSQTHDWAGGLDHQWPVVGGFGALDRGAGFAGFLQRCLELSGM